MSKIHYYIGDQVYDIRFGIGTVANNNGLEEESKVLVDFDCGISTAYTNDGRFVRPNGNISEPILSFKVYRPDKEFSNEKPFPVKKGEALLVKSKKSDEWILRRFVKLADDGGLICIKKGNERPRTYYQYKRFEIVE